jgi:hypothetical protein
MFKSLNLLLNLCKESKNGFIGVTYRKIGEIYLKMEDYSNSIKYLNKSLNILIEEYGEDNNNVYLIYRSIG